MSESRNIVYLADTSGTGKWRRIFQLNTIECVSNLIDVSITSTQFPILDLNYYKGVNSITVQRWLSDQHLNIVKNFFKPITEANRSWLIYEIDDVMDANEIPRFNRGRRSFANEKILSNIREMLNLADLVTVTTKRIKNFYHDHYGVPLENIVAIPNLLPRWWFDDRFDADAKVAEFNRNKAKPRIGFISSLSHFNIDKIRETLDGKEAVFSDKLPDGSIKLVTESGKEVKIEETREIKDDLTELIPLIKETINDFLWVLVGFCPPELEEFAKKGKIEVHSGVLILNYASKIENLHLTAAIAPITKMMFNYCKSPIKYLECCAIGVPLFATNCEPYSNTMPKSALFDSTDELKLKLMNLKFTSAGVYRKMIESNWEWLNTPKTADESLSDFDIKNLWLEDNIDIWVSLFKLRNKGIDISLKSIIPQFDERKKKDEERTLYKGEDDLVIMK